MTNTTNYDLNLIEEHDLLDFAPFNENANIIDGALAELASDTSAIPTMQTAISNNTTAITGLTSRVGEAETEIAANASAIASVQSENSAQWGQINTNHGDIVSESNRITAVEVKQGDIVKFENGAWTDLTSIIKRLTFIGDTALDYENKTSLVIPADKLPDSFRKFYVNASVFSASSNENLATTLYLNRAFIDSYGALIIEFKPINTSITYEGSSTAADLLNPTVNNLRGMADIIFI